MNVYEDIIDCWGTVGPATIVDFQKPWRLFFWSKVNGYGPCWDLGKDVWFSPLGMETLSASDDRECYEPMSDIGNKYAKVNVIAAGDAMTRIHWHYALCNTRHQIFHGNTTADEFYCLYPDGIGVRRAVLWPGDQSDFGGNTRLWSLTEWLLINGPGTTPDANLVPDKAFTLRNLADDKIEIPWPPPEDWARLCQTRPQIATWDEYIGVVNVKNRPSPFIAIANNRALFPHPACSGCQKDHLEIFAGSQMSYRHWPIYDRPYMGYIPAQDALGKVPTHTALGMAGTFVPALPLARPTTFLSMIGASQDPSSSQLTDMVASWLHPAVIQSPPGLAGLPTGDSAGLTPYLGYARADRAYTFVVDNDELTFLIKPNVKVVNPVFRIDGWKHPRVNIRMNGATLDRSAYESQLDDGTLVIWINRNIEQPTEMKIVEDR